MEAVKDACYSREEVSRHDRADDAWVIVDGRVYDVTLFLDTHPGGIGVTESHLGTDISDVIRSEDVHKHTRTAFELMDKYRIGILEDSTSKVLYFHTASQKKIVGVSCFGFECNLGLIARLLIARGEAECNYANHECY